MKNALAYGLLLVFAAFAGIPAFGQDRQATSSPAEAAKVQSDTYGEQLGTVRFPVSCNETARRHAEQGLALLHHMTYEGARAAFAAATETDPDCAMGYWGQTMSFIHPLWSDPPSEAEFERGRTLVNEAKARGQKTEWERAYIRAVEASAYWARQIEIQRLSAKAWLAYQEGKPGEALDTMHRAAELEAATEKHPVTPGEVLPAQELLADMLLEEERYPEARSAYQAALDRSPNRFDSLYGAGRAAELEGNDNAATLYYRKLVEVTAAEAVQARLQHARSFLAEK